MNKATSHRTLEQRLQLLETLKEATMSADAEGMKMKKKQRTQHVSQFAGVLRKLQPRLNQPSTWRGLVLLLTAFGWALSPEQTEAIVVVGLGIAGALGAFVPDSEEMGESK